jgi:hypothetical protein
MAKPDGSSVDIFLELDLSGNAEDNFIKAENHFIESQQATFFSPKYGSYYKEKLKIYSRKSDGSLETLNPGSDYVPARYNSYLSERSGKEVYDLVKILNTGLGGVILIDYQAVGSSNRPSSVVVNTELDNALKAIGSIAFDTVQQRPDKITPSHHKHDVSDFIGFNRVLNSITGLRQVIGLANDSVFGGGGLNRFNDPIRAKLTTISTTVENHLQSLSNALTQHIAGSLTYQHNWSPESVGLKNVANKGFDGSDLQNYCSPKRLKDEIDTRSSPTVSPHITSEGAVHGETKQALGLGSVENYQYVNDFVIGQSYGSLYFGDQIVDQQPKYVGNYALGAAIEYTRVRTVGWANTSLEALSAMVGQSPADNAYLKKLELVSQELSQRSTDLTTATNQVVSSTENVFDDIVQLTALNDRFSVKFKDQPLAAAIEKIITVDYSQVIATTGPRSLWPAPNFVSGLYLWLDFNYERNQYRNDVYGRKRLVTLHDRSSFSRVFAASSTLTAPIMSPSSDRIDGNGDVSSDVAVFGPGTFMNLIIGSGVSIQPGMTVIALFRTGGPSTKFTLMKGLGNSPAKVIAQASESRGLEIVASSRWTAMRMPPNSSLVNRSNLVVACVGDTAAQSWATSIKALDSSYPKGHNTPVQVWPSENYLSDSLDQIGSEIQDAQEYGELSQILIFNQRVSMPMVKAIVSYLRLVETSGRGLNIDQSIVEAF